MGDLRRRVLSSAAWSTGGAMAFRIASLLTGIVAARLLTPHEFGLFTVALVVFMFVGSVADLGIGASVVRAREDEIKRVAPTATTLALGSFAGLGLLLALAAPLIADAFDAPGASNALVVMSLYLVLCGPATVPVGILVREFQQRRRVVYDFLGLMVSSALLVALALADWGEMALAWSRVGGQAFVVLALLLSARRRYRPGWDRSTASAILGVGVPLAGATLLTSTLGAADVFVISRLLNPHEAGVFTLASTIGAWPLGLFLPVLVSVGLPLFSRIRDDPETVGRLLASCMEFIAGVFWPVSALLAVLAPYLVEVLYGAKWAAAASILSVIALAKALEVVMALLSDVLVAGGFTKQYMRSQLVRLAIVLPAAWWAVPRWGSVSVAWVSVLVLVLVVVPWNLATCRRMMTLPTRELFRHLPWPVLGAAVAAGCSHVVADRFDNPWAALVVGGAAGTLLYAALMARWGLGAYRRTMQLRSPHISTAEPEAISPAAPASS